MKEIKLRAWDKKRKIMSMPFDLTDLNDLVITNQTTNGECFTLYDCEIMQYTGLKDKNGREIYKGDIVMFGYGQKSEVKFIDGVFCTGKSYYPLYQWFKHISGVEIIGNIYENPELIK